MSCSMVNSANGITNVISTEITFNLHRDSLFEDVCDMDDCRYNYN